MFPYINSHYSCPHFNRINRICKEEIDLNFLNSRWNYISRAELIYTIRKCINMQIQYSELHNKFKNHSFHL